MIHSMYGSWFIERADLVAHLEERLRTVAAAGRGRLMAIRGRRQVGKSTIVEQFVRAAKVPYVFATGVLGATTAAQVARATESITEAWISLPGLDVFAGQAPTTWREWLARVSVAAKSGPVIMVLDEFPWMVRADPALEGEFQATWDRTLEQLPVLAILIGSDVAMMERLGEHDRALFGRAEPMVVPALNPAEVAGALPGLDAFGAFSAYLATGGFPRLVTDLRHSPAADVEQWVTAGLRDAYSPLATIGALTLDAEFPDKVAAYQVLAAIGASEVRAPSFTDIAGSLGVGQGERKATETTITRALQTLMEVKNVVERETPAWSPTGGKLRRYRVRDPYLRFWFRYVAPARDQISRGRWDLAVTRFEKDWPSWRGRSIEPVVRDGLTRLAAHLPELAEVSQVRPWWNGKAQVEVDAVAMTAQRTAWVGSIKWRTARGFDTHDMAGLTTSRQLVPRATDAGLLAVVPNGQAPAGIDLVVSASNLLSAWAG
jgi:AAA+ ATPase superfamily predicted ATPase